jgi:hypothetical protein
VKKLLVFMQWVVRGCETNIKKGLRRSDLFVFSLLPEPLQQIVSGFSGEAPFMPVSSLFSIHIDDAAMAFLD